MRWRLSLVDSTQLLRIFVWVYAAAILPFLLLFGYPGFLYSFLVSLFLSPLLMYITIKISKAAGKLYSGSASTKSEHELVLLGLEKIRIQCGHRKYDEALREINSFNRSNPNIPEALYLKAQILWDGFRDKNKAISYLGRVMDCSEPGSDYYKWASRFRKELRAIDDDMLKRKLVQQD